VAFVNRHPELYAVVLEGEINPSDKIAKKNGKGNTTCLSKVLGENRDDVIEFNACDKAVQRRRTWQITFIKKKVRESLDCD
jgi:hypothetical protein